MSVNTEFCDPFEGSQKDIWMKLEHCGRYLFACDFIEKHNCRTVIDMASANGYGSAMLAKCASQIIAADRNVKYLQSKYLSNPQIQTLCIDFDVEKLEDFLPRTDAVVCFETIEHLRMPFRFLEQAGNCISENGWLLLSFPNSLYERFNEDGSNKDPYHLQVIKCEDVLAFLKNHGFVLHTVLGQCLCNEICTIQHDLKDAGIIAGEDVNSAFCYDENSIRTLARLMAYPSELRVGNSYSIIIVAKKV